MGGIPPAVQSKLLQPVIQHGEWWWLDTKEGVVVYPEDLFTEEWVKNEHKDDVIEGPEKKIGWGARLSAPGYLDCTEWCVLDSEEEAREYLMDNYGDEG